jgi:hypothetical protein
MISYANRKIIARIRAHRAENKICNINYDGQGINKGFDIQ